MTAVPAMPARAPQDQAERLRALVRRDRPAEPRPRPAVIAIASGKGGVGKTTLAVNLAVALQASGRRVALLDADLGTANADVLCGLTPRARLDAALAPERASNLRTLLQEAPGGFMLLPGAVGVGSRGEVTAADADRLIARFHELKGSADTLIVDTGAGVHAGVQRWMQAADVRLIIATPEPTSIADSYALIKVLAKRCRLAAPGQLLVNQVRHGREAQDVRGRLDAVAERFLGVGVPMHGFVRSDKRVGEAVRAQRPLLVGRARGPAARDIAGLARGLCQMLPSIKRS